MKHEVDSFKELVHSIEDDARRQALVQLDEVVTTHLPKGYKRQFASGMLHWVVPLSTFPQGYHCTPNQPLPFISLASQKNFIALYHMGLYADPELLDWWVAEYPSHAKYKLNMGKSCIRFKRMDDIPYDLVGDLSTKMPVNKWIAIYEKNIQR